MGDAGVIEKVESLRNGPAASGAPPHPAPTVSLGLWMPDGQTEAPAPSGTGAARGPEVLHLWPAQHSKASLDTVAFQGITLKRVSFLSKPSHQAGP